MKKYESFVELLKADNLYLSSDLKSYWDKICQADNKHILESIIDKNNIIGEYLQYEGLYEFKYDIPSLVDKDTPQSNLILLKLYSKDKLNELPFDHPLLC